MNPFRTPAEIAEDIPPVRALKARTLLAAAIVAPVVLARWCWPWLAANAFIGTVTIPLWFDRPTWALNILGASNVIAAVIWGAIRAHRWAVAVLGEEERR